MIKAWDFKVRKSNTLIYLLLFFYLLFISQGIFFPANFFITNILSLVYAAVCFCFLISCNVRNKNAFVTWLSVFVFIQTINFVFTQKVYISILGDPITGLYTIKNTYIALLSFFPFYYYYKRKNPTLVPIVLFLIIYTFIIVVKYLTKNLGSEIILGDDMGVRNLGYSFVTLLPFAAFFLKRRVISLTIILLSMVFVISSMKRGAILVGSLAVCLYFYYSLKNVNLTKWQRKLNTLIVVLGAMIIAALAYFSYISNTQLQERFNTISEGSGRDWIYEDLFSIWLSRSEMLNYLLGYGINSSVRFIGFYAHNDWLEQLLSLGILGVVSYAILLISLFKQSKQIGIYNEQIALKMILLIWCVTSMFSMFYFEVNSFIYLMMMGIIIGKNEHRSRIRVNNTNLVLNHE